MKNTKLLLIFALTAGFTVAAEEFKDNSDSIEDIIKRIKTPTSDPASFSDRQIINGLIDLDNCQRSDKDYQEQRNKFKRAKEKRGPSGTFTLKGWKNKQEEITEERNLQKFSDFSMRAASQLLKNCKDNNPNESDPDTSCEVYYMAMLNNILGSVEFLKISKNNRKCILRFLQNFGKIDPGGGKSLNFYKKAFCGRRHHSRRSKA